MSRFIIIFCEANNDSSHKGEEQMLLLNKASVMIQSLIHWAIPTFYFSESSAVIFKN
jgi:hypothetical protein